MSHPDEPLAFGLVAPYYDELMKQVPYRMWVGYYLLLLAQQAVKPRRILDVCCGTGTMCEMLAREGYAMAGVDLSPGMIAEARRKAKARNLEIRYEVGDAADFDMGEPFDACYSFFDSLNNILSRARLQSAFERVARHLPAGGSFIFDMNTAYAFEARMFDQQDLKSKSRLRYKWIGDWSPDTRMIQVNMRFWYEGKSFRELHTQRAYEEDEIRAMLATAGFIDIRSYHSYTLDPPREKSDRIHFAALRAG